MSRVIRSSFLESLVFHPIMCYEQVWYYYAIPTALTFMLIVSNRFYEHMFYSIMFILSGCTIAPFELFKFMNPRLLSYRQLLHVGSTKEIERHFKHYQRNLTNAQVEKILDVAMFFYSDELVYGYYLFHRNPATKQIERTRLEWHVK